MTLIPNHLFCGAISALLMTATEASAQKRVTIYYNHDRATGNELSYRLPGDDQSRRRSGFSIGDRVTVLQGGTVCFAVDHANPLLYGYSAAAQTMVVPTPEGLSDLLKVVQNVVAASNAPGAQGGTKPAPTTDAERIAALNAELNAARTVAGLQNAYANTLTEVLRRLKVIEDLKGASDGRDDFVQVYRDAELSHQQVLAGLKDAQSAYTNALKPDADTVVLNRLHLLHDIAKQRADAALKEFADARALMSKELCSPVGNSRIRFALSVKSLRGKDATPERPVKDDVAYVEVEPQSDVAFEIAPGVLLGPQLKRQTFKLKNGVVSEESMEDPIVRPAVFALGRLWPLGWLWAGVGAAKGKDATPDVFLGFVARPGLSVIGTQLSVGAGLGLYQVPTGLRAGGQVGSPLPTNVSDLDKVIARGYRSGLAITFNISGLTLDGNGK